MEVKTILQSSGIMRRVEIFVDGLKMLSVGQYRDTIAVPDTVLPAIASWSEKFAADYLHLMRMQLALAIADAVIEDFDLDAGKPYPDVFKEMPDQPWKPRKEMLLGREQRYNGGNLHIQLEDGNLEDVHVKSGLDECERAGDRAGEILCRLLLMVPEMERLGY